MNHRLVDKYDDAARRTLRARMAAHHLHANIADPAAHTAPARRAFLVDRFENEVDPDRALSADERARRADHARKAYFLRLAIKSAEARRSRRADLAGPRRPTVRA